MENLHALEIAVTLWLQGLGTFLIEPMRIISLLGVEEVYILLMPVLYWCVDASLGLRVGIMLLTAQFTNALFKLAFRLPRPYWIDSRVLAYSAETSFGMPSGHAQSAAGIWGLIAANRRRRAVVITCIALIFLIGVSRIYLGVHYFSDVLLGWILGGLLLLVFVRLDRPVSNWLRRLSLRNQILLAAATSLVIAFLPLVTFLFYPSGWTLPPEWVSSASAAVPSVEISPLSITGGFTLAGTWFGLLAGAAYIWKKRGKPDASGTGLHRLLRYLVGLAGVLALWYGLGGFFPRSDDVLSYALRYLRYTLVGLWISALAPLLFHRLGIGKFITPRKDRKRDRIKHQVA